MRLQRINFNIFGRQRIKDCFIKISSGTLATNKSKAPLSVWWHFRVMISVLYASVLLKNNVTQKWTFLRTPPSLYYAISIPPLSPVSDVTYFIEKQFHFLPAWRLLFNFNNNTPNRQSDTPCPGFGIFTKKVLKLLQPGVAPPEDFCENLFALLNKFLTYITYNIDKHCTHKPVMTVHYYRLWFLLISAFFRGAPKPKGASGCARLTIWSVRACLDFR